MTKMYTVPTVVEDPDSHDEHDGYGDMPTAVFRTLEGVARFIAEEMELNHDDGEDTLGQLEEHAAAIANEAREFFARVQREDADQMCKWAKVFGGVSYQIGEMRVFD